MDYKRIYNQLVESARHRGLDKSKHEGYFEIHHIVPRCMGGGDEPENLVMFTAREHYTAHLLLWKSYPEESGLVHSAWMMSNRFSIKNSHVYESLRVEVAESMSRRMMGKYHDLTGQKFGKLTAQPNPTRRTAQGGSTYYMYWDCVCDCGGTLQAVASSLTSGNTRSCGCLSVELGKSFAGENNPFFGKKHTEETKEKFKKRRVLRGKDHPMYGRNFSEEHRRRIGDSQRGVPWSPERRAKHIPRTGEDHHLYGKQRTQETREKISNTLRSKDMKAWEMPGVVSDESHMAKWAMCDYYYDLWKESGELGLKRFTKLFNELHDDNLSLSYFTNPRLKFAEGWIPQNDESWVKFREEYFKKKQ